MKELKYLVVFVLLVSATACAPALQMGAGFVGDAIGKGSTNSGENQKPEKTVIRNEKGEVVKIIYNRR